MFNMITRKKSKTKLRAQSTLTVVEMLQSTKFIVTPRYSGTGEFRLFKAELVRTEFINPAMGRLYRSTIKEFDADTLRACKEFIATKYPGRDTAMTLRCDLGRVIYGLVNQYGSAESLFKDWLNKRCESDPTLFVKLNNIYMND